MEEAGLETLVGMRMRQLKEVKQQALSKRGRFTQLPCGLGIKEVSMYGYRYVEMKTGQSWEQIARLFRQLHVVELITEAGSALRRSDLFKEHKAVLKALGIALPNEIQNVLVSIG